MAMSNQYFQFKQFRIDQQHCAMKVTTDACTQGAWTPVQSGVQHILDIGTGTGLLSLMLAQRTQGTVIDAIEYDIDAAQQAVENVSASPWHDRINIIEGDVCTHKFDRNYDLIITNPPFFNNSLLSDNAEKNKARHTISLSYEELIRVINENLADDGYVSVLLPYPEYLQWRSLLETNGYFEIDKLNVRHTAQSAIKRVVSICRKRQLDELRETTLTIKGDDNKYTPEFTKLLAPFYLDL
jgi:tRNA1Val (adenine37-N6)-methyltransferase